MPAKLTAKGIADSGRMLTDPNRPPASEQDATAPKMHVWDLPKTTRAKYLNALCSFVEGRQHDHLRVQWDGRPRDPGVGYLWERMEPQGFVPTNAAPYGDRKPNASYPLPRQVTMRFTELLLGEGRHPGLHLPADMRTEDYLEAVMEESDTWDALIEARDTSGSCGSAAIALGIVSGHPVAEALHPADLWVRRWKDGSRWEPVEVVEQRLVEVEVVDEDTGEIDVERMWRTRVWDRENVYQYEDVPEDHGKDKKGQGNPGEGPEPIPLAVDPETGEPAIYPHRCGRCPVIWLQNTRNTKSPEGRPDNEGAYHLADRMDRLQSMIIRAAIANVDPTLVFLDDRMERRANPVLRKGWGSVIKGSEKATVKLLEVSGASIEMGWKSLQNLRDEYLQTVGCVIVDPQNAGAYKSGEALQILWRSMEAKGNRLRVPLTDVLKQIAEIWITLGKMVEIVNLEDPKALEGTNESDASKPVLLLPPKVTPAAEAKPKPPPKPGAPPAPTEDDREPIRAAHVVGEGSHVEPTWPPYHVPTATQLQAYATALGMATGQKATVSQETAVTLLMAFLGRADPADEFRKLKKQAEEGAAMFGAAMLPGEPGTKKTLDKADAEDAEALADSEGKKGTTDKPPPAEGGGS